ncbi:SPASM domain-containing protein [Candidatus Woesearchaeota archaeon]|nr:SPASM domain-containing protein [Candidatus Woesearchaeota archaeon]
MYTKGFGSEEEAKFPNIVNICVLRGACPCSCVHCPVGSHEIAGRTDFFGKEVIDLKLYKKIINEISQYPHSTVRIHSVGEPLLWPKLIEALRYAKGKNVKTWVFTSLVTTNQDRIEGLAEYSDILEISLNSIDAEDYLETKGTDSFDLVTRNIKFISELIKRKNLGTRLLLSRVQSKDKQKDSRFVEYWQETGFAKDCFIRSYHDYNGVLTKDKSSKRKIFPCRVHWARFNIDTNGDAAVCFNELFKGPRVEKSLVLGNLKKSSIAEIWQGEMINKIREAQLTADYDRVDFTEKLPCFNCTYCQPMFGKNVTSEHQIKVLAKSR